LYRYTKAHENGRKLAKQREEIVHLEEATAAAERELTVSKAEVGLCTSCNAVVTHIA
jgi:hypothetical protein